MIVVRIGGAHHDIKTAAAHLAVRRRACGVNVVVRERRRPPTLRGSTKILGQPFL